MRIILASYTSHYENVLFEVPDGWSWSQLFDIVSADCTLGYGIVQPMDDIPNGIPIVRPVDLTSVVVGIDGLKRIDARISESYQRTILKGGEILFCVRASVGKVSIASDNLKGANVTRGISPIRFNHECLTKYVFYHLQSFFSQTEIKEYSRGATLQQINVEDLKKLSIAIPPLEEQKRIVDQVEMWMSIIDILENSENDIRESINNAKSKVLNLAIHGKLVPQDANDEPALELLKRLGISSDNRPYENMPNGWAVLSGEKLFKKMVSTKPSGTTFKYIDIDSIDNKNGVIIAPKIIETNRAPSRASRYTQKGDILFSMVRPYLRNIAMVKENECIASTGFFVCNPIEVMDSNFCYYLMRSNYVVDGLNQFMKGDNSPSINNSNIQEWLYPIPPLMEQRRIVSKIEELFSQLDFIASTLE